MLKTGGGAKLGSRKSVLERAQDRKSDRELSRGPLWGDRETSRGRLWNWGACRATSHDADGTAKYLADIPAEAAIYLAVTSRTQ